MAWLQPTPSRSLFRRIPIWAYIVVAVLVGLGLIGAGLLITSSGNDDSAAPAAPTCTPSPATATAPPTAAVRVNIYNATERAGLARETADALKARGFTVVAVTNDPKKATVTTSAVVRHVPGAEVEARWVAAQVPGATLAPVSAAGRTGAKVDLVIGEAYKSLATTAEATAAFVASAPRTTC